MFRGVNRLIRGVNRLFRALRDGWLDPFVREAEHEVLIGCLEVVIGC